MPTVAADEAFYGLGEVFDAVNHRGHVRAMQVEAAPHGLGLQVALWHTPYLDPAAAATASLRAEAEGLGYFPPATGFGTSPWGAPIDLTNPDAAAWWQANLRAYTDTLKVAGFKLDYAEDVVVGALGIRNPWRFYDGSDERTMHARYQLFYHQTYAAMLPVDGGLMLTRAGTFGDQAFTNVVWPGDLDATMARHGEEATDRNGKTYLSVGDCRRHSSAGSRSARPATPSTPPTPADTATRLPTRRPSRAGSNRPPSPR